MSESPVSGVRSAKIPDSAKFPKTTSCRERITFPWQGRLTRAASGKQVGTLVVVTGKQGNDFSAQEGRLQDKPDGPLLTIGEECVDEAVASVIEDSLLYNKDVCWNSRRAWWNEPYAAVKDFVMSEWLEEGPTPREPAQRQVKTGERFGGMDHSKKGEGYFLAGKYESIYKVPCDMLDIIPKIPPLSSGVTLLCYELGMYAAALAGLLPDFVQIAISAPEKFDKSSYWIMRSGGTTDMATSYGPTKLDSLRLQRGDIVLFYNNDETHTSEHTAVATGDGQGVYSIWEPQDDYVNARLTTIQDLFKVMINFEPAFTCVRIGTPGWHSKR